MHSNSSLIMRIFKVFVLIAIAAISYYSVACCLLSQSVALHLLGALLYIAGIINAFTFEVTGSFPDAELLGVAIQERFLASSFMIGHWKLIVFAVTYSIAIYMLFAVIRFKYSIFSSNKVAAVFLLCAILANIIWPMYTGGRRSAFYGYNAIIELTKALSTKDIPYARRSGVAGIECPQCPDVLLYIIDESVTYEALSHIRSIVMDDSAIRDRLGVPAFTFKSYSAGNHSSVSNYILRLGLGKSSYPDSQHLTLGLPNLFAFARAAHYTTVFYDAQQEDKRLVNYMSQYDLAAVDHFITADASSDRYDRDMLALTGLQGFIDQASPENKLAIVLIKNGVHFPYVNSIPPALIGDLPADCHSPDTSFTSQKMYCKKAQYEIALKFSVDQFLDRLFDVLAGKNFALIYTSDHGQDLSSRYSLAHGSVENTSECEISVPILIAGNVFADIGQQDGLRSHFQIPPTLLQILGQTPHDPTTDDTLWFEWQGGPDFLHDPFEQNGQWHQPVKPCIY
jgi:hypothetical protein